MTAPISEVRKRDGRMVPFDIERIIEAAYKAMLATHEGTRDEAVRVAQGVVKELKKRANGHSPFVEEIQDLVEKELMQQGFVETAKAYILYRKQRADLRAQNLGVPEAVREKIEESRKYFQNPLAEFVYYRSYARWLENERRRETWVETVDRFLSYMKERLGEKLTKIEYDELYEAILSQKVIPSMRLVWAAGKAARATHVSAYNCSFIIPTCFQDFGEMMYLLMCGTGVGFSVEKKMIDKLPEILPQTGKKVPPHVIGDSKEGWANAFVVGMKTWYEGKDIEFDYTKIRPRGARLKTMGGRASGPGPLRALMEFAKGKIVGKQGKKLSTLDVHDMICKIGEIVVAGGVRRSALISLSDIDDELMRDAKAGQFYLSEPQRSMANNSAIYNEKPEAAVFLEEWLALVRSGTGERGLFNRGGLKRQLPARRWKVFEKYADTAGTNPCGEIILRSKQFCNLTSVVIRSDDTRETLLEKMRLASILGTYQATLLDFPYLSPEWKENCEEEALLGVSLTGYWDNKVCRNKNILQAMRDTAVEANKKYAKRFGINQSTCVTCVKPSGNSSQLLDTASGMHPRYAKYYARRVRVSSTDPILHMLREQGVPCYPEVGQPVDKATTYVVEFPAKSPDGAICKDDVSAIELLEHWKLLKENFTEHNPSATIYVGDDEWIEVANWVYKHWDIIGGLSFLPRSNHVYQLAPYEEIHKNAYEELCQRVENVDFSKLVLYEREDSTDGAKEYACVSGACEI